MPIFIPVVIGLGIAGASIAGIITGKRGYDDLNKAKKSFDRSKKRYELSLAKLESSKRSLNLRAEEYGKYQRALLDGLVFRMLTFLERNEMQLTEEDKTILKSVGVKFSPAVGHSEIDFKLTGIAFEAVRSASVGASAYFGVSSAASTFGVASTGAAISGLSGAAGTSATLAWLGGGSLAAGGGGVALGSVVLSGVAIGPALLIGGFVLASKGEKALTEAKSFSAKVDIAIAQIATLRAFFTKVRNRLNELTSVLQELEFRGAEAMDALESLKFDRKDRMHVVRFQEAMIFVRSICEILNTHIIDSNGNLNERSATVCEEHTSYRRQKKGA